MSDEPTRNEPFDVTFEDLDRETFAQNFEALGEGFEEGYLRVEDAEGEVYEADMPDTVSTVELSYEDGDFDIEVEWDADEATEDDD